MIFVFLFHRFSYSYYTTFRCLRFSPLSALRATSPEGGSEIIFGNSAPKVEAGIVFGNSAPKEEAGIVFGNSAPKAETRLVLRKD